MNPVVIDTNCLLQIISRHSPYRPNPAEEDIRLIPVGFVNDNWKCDTTTDPDVFWAKPEM